MRKILIASIFPVFILANEFSQGIDGEISWLKEETFVVSASRVKENIKKSAASITVIDEDMIKNMGANNLLDILRAVSGMGVSQSNIYINKLESRGIKTRFGEKILIMLDGHSLNVNLLNGGATAAYKYFPVEIIQRVEIIKGPSSALYGENAFTAVINIITKESSEIDGVLASVKYGSYNTKTANILYGKKYENFEVTANFNYKDTNGDSRYIKSDVVGNSGYTNPYADSLYAYLFLKYDNGLYLKGNYNTINEGPRYGALYALNNEDYSQRETYFVELGYEKQINKSYSVHARTYFDKYKTDNNWELYPEGFPSPIYTNGLVARTGFITQKYGLEVLLTRKIKNVTIVSGISYEKQDLKNPTLFANYNPSTNLPVDGMQGFSDPSTNYVKPSSRSFYAGFGEVLYDIEEDVRLSIGLRYDKYSDFGASLNPRLGATWAVNKNNNIKLMYGTAFRAPTFSELYNINNPVLLGNPNLKPESIKTTEIILENESIDSLDLSLTMYKSDIHNVILEMNGQYENFARLETIGVEIEGKYDLTRGSYLLANYTYKKPTNQKTNQDLIDIANHEAYLALVYRINKEFNIYLDAKYIGAQTRISTDTRKEVGSSIVSNLTLISEDFIVDRSSIRLSIYNMFDEKSYDSSTPIDYPIASRSYMAELTYKF